MSSVHAPTSRVSNRYGAPKRAGLPRRRLWIALVLAAAVVAVGFFAFSSAQQRVTFKDVGFAIDGNSGMRVDFEVTKPADATAQCAVQALSQGYAVVGWKTVTIGPTPETEGANGGRTTSQRVDLRTDSAGVTGGVDSCWLVD